MRMSVWPMYEWRPGLQEPVVREWRPGLQELCQVHSIAFQDELFVRF